MAFVFFSFASFVVPLCTTQVLWVSRLPQQGHTNTEECVAKSGLTPVVIRARVQKALNHNFTNLSDDQIVSNQEDMEQFATNPTQQITTSSKDRLIGNTGNHTIVDGHDNHDGHSPTIGRKRTRGRYKLPPLYERLSQYETLAFLYQKFIPGLRRQDVSLSSQSSEESSCGNEMVDEIDDMKKGSTFASNDPRDNSSNVQPDHTKSDEVNLELEEGTSIASNISAISNTSKDSRELESGDLLIENNYSDILRGELDHNISFASSKKTNKLIDTIEDASFDEEIYPGEESIIEGNIRDDCIFLSY